AYDLPLLLRCSLLRGSSPFPYTTLFRSCPRSVQRKVRAARAEHPIRGGRQAQRGRAHVRTRRQSEPECHVRSLHRLGRVVVLDRSEEHTSELQSRSDLVCRLLLEKKKNQ